MDGWVDRMKNGENDRCFLWTFTRWWVPPPPRTERYGGEGGVPRLGDQRLSPSGGLLLGHSLWFFLPDPSRRQVGSASFLIVPSSSPSGGWGTGWVHTYPIWNSPAPSPPPPPLRTVIQKCENITFLSTRYVVGNKPL